MNEIVAVQQIHHEKIVGTRGHCVVEKKVYILLEFVYGYNLDQIINLS